jgi:nicotinate-nucleotide adenylyltransferase
VYGGTFDPPHRAHATLPPLAADRLGCERVLYVPASSNPLKPDAPTSAAHRLAMLRLALRDVPRAEICTLELEREGPSYTVDTLETLRETLAADVGMRLLVGADAALSFPRWRRPERILELAEPAVMLRPPWDETAFRTRLADELAPDEAAAWAARIVPLPTIDVSAEDIRARLQRGEPVGDALDPAVAAYVDEHGLYGG